MDANAIMMLGFNTDSRETDRKGMGLVYHMEESELQIYIKQVLPVPPIQTYCR